MSGPFRGGHGRGGRGGAFNSGRGGPSNGVGQICNDFKRGSCRYGSKCKFSHDLSSNQEDQRPARRARAKQTAEQKKALVRYQGWKSALSVRYAIPNSTKEHELTMSGPDKDDFANIAGLWRETMIILLRDDRDTKQYLSRDLEDEEGHGREYISILMDIQPSTEQLDDYVVTCHSFLRFLGHPEVLDCLATETYVGRLYQYVSGTNGTRAIPFAMRLCESAMAMQTEENRTANPLLVEELGETLLALTSTLCELMKREPSARRNKDLAALVSCLESVAHRVTEDGDEFTSGLVQQHIGSLNSYVFQAETATGIADSLADLNLGSDPTSAHTRKRIMPGDRHDNDKTDISEIVIFPTSDEIKSDAQEFLPSTLPGEWHYLTDNVQRHIDSHFRLFRHDMLGALKVALANVMDCVGNSPAQLMNTKINVGDTRAYVYTHAIVENMNFGRRGREQGLQAQFAFMQPSAVSSMTPLYQQRWWEDANRFEEGVLLSYIWIENGAVQHLFFTVATLEADTRMINQIKRKLVNVRLVTETRNNINTLISLARKKANGMLLEFPSIIPSTFVSVLESLQNIQRLGRLPFSQWIVPNCTKKAFLDIPAPMYARKPGFSFSLEPIMLQPGEKPIKINATSSVDDEELVDEMEKQVGLDHGQCRAMVAALTREFAFIQGPPGTGKTHLGVKLMEVLLNAKKEVDLGPVIVVCYTNHALDQFLEHLIYSGMDNVIRIGARSKSELLQDYNLTVVSQMERKTKAENKEISQAYKDLDEHHSDLDSGLDRLLFEKKLNQKKKDAFFGTLAEVSHTQKHLSGVQEEVRRRCLQNADVVGLTTSGLAKNIATLQRLRCKVVICEEAGEVLEAHMLSAMLPTVEHCIQIGDHEQLRPTINEYDLSLESSKGRLYQLDRSQFERLCTGEPGRPRMPIVQLDTQRRMRREVSTLIRETLYPKLIDHPSIAERENVVGMRQNVFWLNHHNAEEQQYNGTSKSNAWEVEMTRSLVRHLVRQGAYKSTEIAVLTPYMGQLQRLRAAMSQDFQVVLSDLDHQQLGQDGFDTDDKKPTEQNRQLETKPMTDLLRLATVDNFQGEEAKVIIVSLVRSNPEKKVGFLRTTNRINVLLSRARNGMYLIGNADTYSNVPMWKKVIGILQTDDCVGTSLALCCPRHKNKVISISQPADFRRLSPEGGCQEKCGRRSECGHMCLAKCHSDDMHDVWKCPMPCERRFEPCGHSCTKAKCGDECGQCMVKRLNIKLPCGHVKKELPCHQLQHLDTIPCLESKKMKVPRCGHVVPVKCGQDVNSQEFACPVPCVEKFPCGHTCAGKCCQCNIKSAYGGVIVMHQGCENKICVKKAATVKYTNALTGEEIDFDPDDMI